MQYILKPEMYFNPSTLNVFTDASIIKTKEGETIGCAGICAVVENNIISEQQQIVRFSTNNRSEITAIYMAVMSAALQFRKPTINIFSDSKICIMGLREWIYSWVAKAEGDTLISSQGKPVANQDIIMRIISVILSHRLSVNFYHINGHINPTNPDQLLQATKTFKTSNNIQNDVSLDLISKFAYYNDRVDNVTRDILFNTIFPVIEKPIDVVNFEYTGFNTDEYSKLVRR